MLDPFVGCGTVCEVAQQLRRNSVGIDISSEYVALARGKIKEKEMLLCETIEKYGANNKKRNSSSVRLRTRVVAIKC